MEEGADYIIAETFMEAGEAYLALDCIQKYGKGTHETMCGVCCGLSFIASFLASLGYMVYGIWYMV